MTESDDIHAESPRKNHEVSAAGNEPAGSAPAPPLPVAHPVVTPAADRKSGMSIASLVLGILTWFVQCAGSAGSRSSQPSFARQSDRIAHLCGELLVPVILASLAIWMGYAARSRRQASLGLAKTGVILGVAYLAVLLCMFVYLIILLARR